MDDKENLNNNNFENQNNLNSNTENPYDQNTEDNPYYNPYFQNTDIGNSPYYNNNSSDINLNNDIYNQSYMNNNETYNNNLEQDNNASMQNNSNNMQDTETSQNSTVSNTPSAPIAEEPVNLFNISESAPSENTASNNTAMPNSNTETDTNIGSNEIAPESEPNSQMHINPILSQTINQNGPEQTLNMNNNQFDTMQQDVNNNQFGTMQQDANNNQFNEQVAQNTYGNSNDEEFKKSWMGKLYDKANSRKFSIPAFFFGGIYYLYRKLYLFGFIFTLLNCIIYIFGASTMISSIVNSSSIVLPIILTLVLPIILDIVYGFVFYPLYKGDVNKKLANYKNEVQNPTQLLDTAKQKGGTSVGFVLIGILLNGVVSSVLLTILTASTLSGLMQNVFGGVTVPQNQINTNTSVNNNDVHTPTYDTYEFYNDYYFDYDASVWTEDSNNKLVSDNYTLSYIQSIENLSSVGFDINQNDGRSSFFTYLYNLFSSQIDATTTTLELGSSSFVYDNGIYYSYFDLVYSASIERCYFVLIPEDDIFIEFILSNTDTVIPDDIHNEVVSYICSITNEPQEQESDEINGNSINENTVLNGNSVDVDNGISTSGSIDAGSLNEYATPASGSNSSNTAPSSNGGLTVTSPSSVPGITTAYNVVTQ